MKIELDLVKLKKWGLNINEYLTLLRLQKKLDKEDIPFFARDLDIESLIIKELIERTITGLAITKKGLLIVSTKAANKDRVEALLPQLREIFPLGKKSGQYPWRSTPANLKVKLTSFLKKYKYTDEEIIGATQKYVASFSHFNRDAGMQTLKYFIEKDGISTLADWIEANEEPIEKSSTFETDL